MIQILKKIPLLIGSVLLLATGIFALQREEIVLSEELLSPAWEKYDCHSSSLVQTAEGTILAVWKGGYGEGKSNLDLDSEVGIWLSVFDGKKWTPSEMIHFEKQSVVWNPVLAQLYREPLGLVNLDSARRSKIEAKRPNKEDHSRIGKADEEDQFGEVGASPNSPNLTVRGISSNELLLFYRVGKAPWASVAFLKRSSDAGKSWSDPEILPAGIIGPAKNKPLLLKNGMLLCPSSLQSGSPDEAYRSTAVWIDMTPDGGRTWTKSGPLTIPNQPFGAIEPALFFDSEGNLRLLCRDRAYRAGNKNGWIWTAVSTDEGKTWSSLQKTDLPNPDSAFDVADLGDGALVLIYNHSHTQRFPLSVAISTDGGKSWERKCDLEDLTGEFPAAIVAEDGNVHVTYAYEVETGQRRIKHVVIDPRPLFE